MSFCDKVALVTGGGDGIGKAIVDGLLMSGAKVSFLEKSKGNGLRTLEEFEKTYGKSRILFCEGDVRHMLAIDEFFQKSFHEFGKVDIVINNAGILREVYPDWVECILTNVMGVIRGTELGFRYMSKNNGHSGGVIINTSSTASLIPCAPVPVYSSTKAFVNHYTRSVGMDEYYEKTGVKVMAILPGITETSMIHESASFVTSEMRQSWIEMNENLKPQNPRNISEAVKIIIEKGENGSLWSVTDDEPPIEVTLNFTR